MKWSLINAQSIKNMSFLFTLFFCVYGFSQTLGSRLEKKTIALGEIDTLKINISNLQGKKIEIAPKNKLLPFHFEIISDSTSVTNDFLDRTIIFSVYEEGKFIIPALDVKIGGQLYNTIPYELEVINSASKDNQISDIMNNKKVDLGFKDYWQLYKFYVLGALIILGIIFVIFTWIKYGRKRKNSPIKMTNQTLKELDALRKKKYIENGDFRSFYVELIDINRNFITKQYKIPADVLLTDDLIDLMKNTNSISPENEKTLEEIFLRGDLVKFAKTFPSQQMMEEDFDKIRTFVKNSSKDLEIEELRVGV